MKAGDDTSDVALHSSRIGAAATLAPEEEVPQRMIQMLGAVDVNPQSLRRTYRQQPEEHEYDITYTS